MLFKNEKYKKNVRDVILVFFYLGLIFIMFSSIFKYTFFSIDVFIIGIVLLAIGSGMTIIIMYYYIKGIQKQKLKIHLERMLAVYVVLSFLILLSTITMLFLIKIGVLY